MKKILLAVSALFIIGAVFAQSERVDYRKNAVAVPYVKKAQLTGFENGAEPQTQPSMVRLTGRNFIGTTFYDCQSNGSMSQRVVAHNDGTVSAIWTTCGSTSSSRGTGYNYNNGSNWINSSASTDRIENVRTGWGTMTAIGDVEIVASHYVPSVTNNTCLGGLQIGICPQKGTNNWTFSLLQGPTINGIGSNGNPLTSSCLLWPALASSGNTVHLICCSESDTGMYYQGINTCLLYYRGTFDPSSNTISWENPRIVGNVTPAEVKRFSGDSYAITAKGDNVAIVAMPSSTMDAFLWKSTDNGQTFTKTVFLESAIKNNDLTAMLDTNLYVQDDICAVALGDDGTTHIAFGAYLVVSDEPTGDSWYWYPGIGELVYWNENMSPILYNNNDMYMQPEVLRNNGCTVIERFNLDCDESIWSLSSWGVDAFPSYGAGSVSFPQLVAENGNIYMVFCQVLEYPFIDVNSSKYYRGVFATKSTNNGQSFGDYSWLSYNKDCYYLNSWDLFPLDSTTTYEQVAENIYNEGESVFPAVAQKLVNGKLFMTWQQDYFAGSEIKDNNVGICSDESNLLYFTMDANQIGVYNNTNEVCQGLWIDSVGINNRNISGMKLYPNPASESVNLTFSAENSEPGVVSVMNLMGQTIYTNNVEVNEGYNMINVPVKNFTSGVYMVTLRTNTGISTQKLIVK